MGRFIAVECDDGKARIHDSETGDWARITFAGPNAFDMAWGCARQWNYMLEKQAEAMDEWVKGEMFADLPSKDDLDNLDAELEAMLNPQPPKPGPSMIDPKQDSGRDDL